MRAKLVAKGGGQVEYRIVYKRHWWSRWRFWCEPETYTAERRGLCLWPFGFYKYRTIKIGKFPRCFDEGGHHSPFRIYDDKAKAQKAVKDIKNFWKIRRQVIKAHKAKAKNEFKLGTKEWTEVSEKPQWKKIMRHASRGMKKA